MTDHFRDEVIGPNRKPGREGITYEMCIRIVREDWYSDEQGEERIFWGYTRKLPGNTKWLKVVTDLQREVLVTAHKDRDFAKGASQRERERERGEE